MFNILVVDDNDNIRNLMITYLERKGYRTIAATDGLEALAVLEREPIDLMIVDIMMPNMDGHTLTQDLRSANYDFPILMITAKERMEDKRKGFLAGTDDYMVKPIELDEMLLRVIALLRRAKVNTEKRIVIGDVILDYNTLIVKTKKKEILIPKKEFYLLFKLLSYPKKIFTRRDLMNDIWGYDTDSDERTVDVHIRRLREKFNDLAEFNIVTVKGLGYKAEINL
ncbi:DNA-binding response regulator [Oceanobacillus arenosus]|uniref:Heme response regulator HssR n=1 Tax=Oceanobacillus arenosus TaxID=1229153 RepID=A0A3D8PLC4_9BACI|nr:response regulator transcription factor [Oceanobacillus arenosus]RDW16038.1 DNA-binding response regulator [Oceanobacillus arenosus]